MAALKENEINDAVREVLKRTVVDMEFRAKALSDGDAAIAEVSGKTLPTGTSINFVSNSDTNVKSIVLPDPVSEVNLLTEEELEQIAGGMAACGASTCGVSS